MGLRTLVGRVSPRLGIDLSNAAERLPTDVGIGIVVNGSSYIIKNV